MIRATLLGAWRAYFNPRAWEADGRVYERLGIRHVSKVLVGGRGTNAVLSRLRGTRHRMIRGKRGAYEWLVFTVVAELGHGFFLLVMLAIAMRQGWSQRWSAAATTMGLNLVINFIPMLVQRYNRGRILRAFGLDAGVVCDTGFWMHLLDPGRDPEQGATVAANRYPNVRS